MDSFPGLDERRADGDISTEDFTNPLRDRGKANKIYRINGHSKWHNGLALAGFKELIVGRNYDEALEYYRNHKTEIDKCDAEHLLRLVIAHFVWDRIGTCNDEVTAEERAGWYGKLVYAGIAGGFLNQWEVAPHFSEAVDAYRQRLKYPGKQ